MGKKKSVPIFTAEEIIAYRNSLGLRQEEFAEIYGISVSTLRNWEQGRAKPIPQSKLQLFIAVSDWKNKR